MAAIGQIVYNVQDYQTSGGYISTSNSNIRETIKSVDDPDYNLHKIQIWDTDARKINLVTVFGASQFTKLGVNAPPGTRFILNGEDEKSGKVILIGRSGIYELDETITSLKFIRPRKYIKDLGASSTVLQLGSQGLRDAENYRIQRMRDDLVGLSDEAYWNMYNDIQTKYNERYQTALSQFNMGLHGVYKLPNESNISADENFEELYNIIVDFVYV